jgi:uncharacterized membrane protein
VKLAVRAWLWVAAFLAVGVALYGYRYLIPATYPPPGEVSGGIPNVFANRFAGIGALAVHASLAATALFLGAFQLFPGIRARWPAWHRRAGTVYVIACLGGGGAGLLLALGATSGPIATAGFGLLAITWMGCTANAWRYARARNFVRHRRWMLRSYALSFAAVTLRIYLPIAIISHLDVAAAYRAIAFLCWVPNLALMELWLRRAEPTSALRTNPRPAAASQSPG